MMNIRNLGLEDSVGVKSIDSISSKQSLRKVSSETAELRYFSKYVFLNIPRRCYPVNIAKFLRTAFLQKTPGSYSFQFDKVTVQHWASADLSFLIKNNVGWFLQKRFKDLFKVRYIVSRNHSNTFLLINLQKSKTCP